MTKLTRQNILLLVSLGLVSPVWGASIVASAQVELMSPLEIGETQTLDFGRILNLNGSCQMLDDGTLQATGAQTCDGQQAPAEFTVSGDAGQAVDIGVQVDHGESGLTFVPKLVGDSARVLGAGGMTFNVVGTLNITSASEGQYAIPYVVTVNYQ